MKRFRVAALALFVVAAGQARADVLYNNFGPGDTYDTRDAAIIGRFPGDTVTWVQGDPFRVTGADYTLDRLTLALGWFSGPNQVDVQFRADAGGLPGAVIESFHLTDLGPLFQNNPPVVANSVLHPLLSAGAQYWVTASASDQTDVGWNTNSTGDTGPHAQSQNGGPFNVITSDRGAYRVEATPSPVPEPGTLLLCGIGGLGLLGYRWGRRKLAA
jgi:hypothetical protein